MALDEIRFVDRPTIRFNKNESVDMPFRYVENGHGEPVMPVGMKELIYEDMNKSFEF